jgi:LacI family transcriptional regulator
MPIVLPPRELIPRDSTDVFASDDEMVAKALRYIADNCHKPINVTDVVQKLRVCGRTLARRFQKARGCRPIDELTRMRITRAKRLLQESDASIRDVAEQCGFATGSQFILAFRRVEKMTPGEYRERA